MKKILLCLALVGLVTDGETTLNHSYLQILKDPSSLFLYHSRRIQSHENGLAKFQMLMLAVFAFGTDLHRLMTPI